MPREITIKEVKEIFLEAQSHSGLPYSKMQFLITRLLFFNEILCKDELIPTLKNKIINEIMIYYHNYKRNPNKNIKAYDWC